MSLAALTRTDIQTERGTVPLWHRPGALSGTGPALLVINSVLVDPDTMSRLWVRVGAAYDVFVLHMPGGVAPALDDASIAATASAMGAAIEALFAGRPVVLAGFGMGAVVALAIRAAPVRRIVAMEPILLTEGLWPLEDRLRQAHASHLRHRPMIEALFGVTQAGVTPRDYLPLLDTLEIPADVLVGEVALGAPREVQPSPSLVGDAARRRLRDHPKVRLHVAQGAGRNLSVETPILFKQLMDEAVAAALGQERYDPALLLRAPLDVASLAYVGPAPDAFEAAYRRRNPTASVTAARTAQALDGLFELIVLDDLDAVDAGWLDSRLAPEGRVVASMRASATPPPFLHPLRRLRARIAPDFFDDWREELPQDGAGEERLILVARRQPPASPPLNLRIVTYAARLMDIRTRLPAQALRSDPDLKVAYQREPAGSHQGPAVLVLQRPSAIDAAQWRNWMSAAMRNQCLLVLECDDHPDLIARALDRPILPEQRTALGYPHAIQTSTPELAELFSRYNPEVRVFANAVFDLPPFPDALRPPRIFYGAVPRGEFSVEVARSLAPAIAAFPRAEFVIVGDQAVFDALPTGRKAFHDYMPYEAYLALMGECSILLTPLEAGLHDGKSDAKFLDAASRGLLTIASPTAYGATIRHGETGLIARTAGDWPLLLARALADPQASLAMARKAWDYVRGERMFAGQAGARRDWYRSLMDRRAELDAGVARRLPGLAV